MGVSVTFLILQYATVRHTRESERTESRNMQGIADRRKKQATRADKSIRAWSSGRASAGAGEKVTESCTLNVMQEQDGRGRRWSV